MAKNWMGDPEIGATFLDHTHALLLFLSSDCNPILKQALKAL